MKQNSILSMLGLAAKAGKLASGEFATEKAVKSRKAFLVFVAGDASANTKKMFQNMCTFYKVPMTELSNKEELGHCIGKQFRASIAVLDEGFSKSLLKKINLMEEEHSIKTE